MARLFIYNVVYQCHSMKPSKAIQSVGSKKSEAGVDLVADVRRILADEFKRDTDEIEILAIYGTTDPKQVWPPKLSGDGVIADTAAGGIILGQGEGAGTGADTNSNPPSILDPVTLPWPTIEDAGALTKQQMMQLAVRLEIPEPTKIPFPDLRAAVLKALNAKLSGQSA